MRGDGFVKPRGVPAFGPNPQIRYYQSAIKFDGGMT
jgi:hypothetical protein